VGNWANYTHAHWHLLHATPKANTSLWARMVVSGMGMQGDACTSTIFWSIVRLTQ